MGVVFLEEEEEGFLDEDDDFFFEPLVFDGGVFLLDVLSVAWVGRESILSEGSPIGADISHRIHCAEEEDCCWIVEG